MSTDWNPDLSKLLDPLQWSLLAIARRQFVLEAFTADLDRVCRNRAFRIRNGVTWMLLLDTRDMHVVHFASWAKGVYAEDGLIDQLLQQHTQSFPRALPTRSVSSDDPDWVRRHDQVRRDREHAEAYSRLFLNARAFPNGADFDQLRKAFAARMKPLVNDRNWNRAHVFEKVSGTTDMLSVADLRGLMDYAEQFLDDLTMVGCHHSMSRSEMNAPSAASSAPELVDAILLGAATRAARLRGQVSRDDHYADLHARFDGATAAPGKDRYFNDV